MLNPEHGAVLARDDSRYHTSDIQFEPFPAQYFFASQLTSAASS